MATTVGTLQAVFTADTSDFNRGLTSVNNSLKDFSKNLGNRISVIGNGFTSLGASIAGITAPVAGAFLYSAKAAIEFEDAFADVVKTVNASDEVLTDIRAQIRAMATEKSNPLAGLENAHVTLAKLFSVGAQLGIPTENLAEFAQVTGELSIATDLAAEEAAVFIARIANLTNLPVDQYRNFGSTLVALGNNLATTESEILSMANRISSAGSLVGFGVDQILGYSAALSSLGISAELGGTNFSKLLLDINKFVSEGGTKLNIIAEVADMTSEQFKKAWGENASMALLSFLKGLGQLGSEEQLKVLDQLGFKGMEITRIILGLANNTDLLKKSLSLSAKSWIENTALYEEAKKRLQTTASQINVLKNRVKDLAIEVGDALLPTIRQLLDTIQPVIKDIIAWVRENPKLVKQIAMVTAGFALFAAVLIPLGLTLQSIGTIVTVVGSALSLLISPIGLVIAGLVALGVAYKTNFMGFGDAVDDLVARIKSVLPSVVQFITELVGLLSKGDLEGAFNMLKEPFVKLAASIAPSLLQGLSNLQNFVLNNIIAPLAAEALLYVSSGQLFDNLKTLGSALLSAVEFGLMLYVDYWTFVFKKIIKPLADQVANYITSGQLFDNLKTLGSALLTAIEFGISVYVDYWTFIFKKIIKPLAEQVASFVGIGTLWDNLKQLGLSMLTAITNGILDSAGYFTFIYDNFIRPFADQLMLYISTGDLWGALVYLGQTMLQGIKNGITGYVGFTTFVYDTIITPLTEQLSSAVSNVRTTAELIGEAMMEGIGVGVRNLIGSLEGIIKGAINDIVPSEISLSGSFLGHEINAGTVTLPKPFPGYRTGTSFTGFGGFSELAGYVHKGEAVVPHNGMRVYPSPSGLRLVGAAPNGGTTIVINGDVNLPNVRNSTDFIRELQRTAKRMANKPF